MDHLYQKFQIHFKIKQKIMQEIDYTGVIYTD